MSQSLLVVEEVEFVKKRGYPLIWYCKVGLLFENIGLSKGSLSLSQLKYFSILRKHIFFPLFIHNFVVSDSETTKLSHKGHTWLLSYLLWENNSIVSKFIGSGGSRVCQKERLPPDLILQGGASFWKYWVEQRVTKFEPTEIF